jgi:hypothetical protein
VPYITFARAKVNAKPPARSKRQQLNPCDLGTKEAPQIPSLPPFFKLGWTLFIDYDNCIYSVLGL